MIKLYREENSPQADAIEAEFKELVMGYDRVVVEPQQAGAAQPQPVPWQQGW